MKKVWFWGAILAVSLFWNERVLAVLPAQEPATAEPAKAENILLKDFRPVSRYKILRKPTS